MHRLRHRRPCQNITPTDEFRPSSASKDPTTRKGVKVPQIKHVGRVMVPVADQDTAIAFYTEKLGFSLTADVPFGEGDRWVEVGLPAGGATIALVPVNENYPAGGMTGIALD